MKSFKFIITARRESTFNSCTLYFVNSDIHGFRMIEDSQDVAYQCNNKKEAKYYIKMMSEQYKGLTNFKIRYRKISIA